MHIIQYTNNHDVKRTITFRADQIKDVFCFIRHLNKHGIKDYSHTFED
jgi:hypothetical protein